MSKLLAAISDDATVRNGRDKEQHREPIRFLRLKADSGFSRETRSARMTRKSADMEQLESRAPPNPKNNTF